MKRSSQRASDAKGILLVGLERAARICSTFQGFGMPVARGVHELRVGRIFL
jgi:hypothetical protein